jgi:hypothetical protein
MRPQLNAVRWAGEMHYFVSNGLGESKDTPSEVELRDFLDNVDPGDVEHGAAWVSDELDNNLEFNGDGTLVFSRGLDAAPRHLTGVSKSRALELWLFLMAGRLDDLESQPWMPGLRPPLPPEEAARRQRELADWQHQDDRNFYELLGAEQPSALCRKDGCARGRISHSALCRIHHFESIRGRPCPFDE